MVSLTLNVPKIHLFFEFLVDLPAPGYDCSHPNSVRAVVAVTLQELEVMDVHIISYRKNGRNPAIHHFGCKKNLVNNGIN